MAGMVAVGWRERAEGLLGSAMATTEAPSKMKQLRILREVILRRDPALLMGFAPRLAELHDDSSGPVRQFVAEMIGEVGLKHVETLPSLIPLLLSFLSDDTPAVTRQAIKSGTSLFRHVLTKVSIEGLSPRGITDALRTSWMSMLDFRSAVITLANQSLNDGIRLLAVKFVESLILLYTPDPNGLIDFPSEAVDGIEFNISWIRTNHPLLNIGDLSIEASQSLGLLLDQLKGTQVTSLSNSIVIVIISSLSAIATKRPSFYGRILSVLLSLDPERSVVKGVEVAVAYNALRSAFLMCFNCTHSSAAPWRARLLEAMKSMENGSLADQTPETNNSSGSMILKTEEPFQSKEGTDVLPSSDEDLNDLGRKRQMRGDNDDLLSGDVTGKRVRLISPMLPDATKESNNRVSDTIHSNSSKVDSVSSRGMEDSKPVQQLVSMFGALVAQGDKAAQSLEILISSISSDLLAEVVISNIRNFPPSGPLLEGEDILLSSDNIISNLSGSSHLVAQLTSLVGDGQSLSSTFPLTAPLLAVQPSRNAIISSEDIEEKVRSNLAFSMANVKDATAATTSSSPSAALNLAASDNAKVSDDVQKIEGGIPGLASSSSIDDAHDSMDTFQTHTKLPEASQEQFLSSTVVIPLDISQSLQENLSPRGSHTDQNSICSTSSSVSSLHFLPIMAIHDVKLTDEDKDQLQKEALMRILEAFRQIVMSDSSHILFSLLSHLGIEFPLELDAWGVLQKHILSDYLTHEGHELTLHILYRLYRESEQDQDFLSSRTATSVYDTFLLNVAETLRDTFPASDKSLGKLLIEAPYLPSGVLNLLDCLCSPDDDVKNEKDFQGGDRATQGLSIVWSLILQRPSNRDRCLQIALRSTIHQIEEVRMKAIRLVANKLYPMPSISKKIEEFAVEKLHSMVQDTMDVGTDASTVVDTDSGVVRAGGEPSSTVSGSELVPSISDPSSALISEAIRLMSLYFALCTKKHSLLQQIFNVYGRLSKTAKQAIHRHIPILVRTTGASVGLLGVISDLPTGSTPLLIQVLQTLTDGTIPSQELIFSVKELYNSKLKDVEILIPILSFFHKDELIPIVHQLVDLPSDRFQVAISRILQGTPQVGPSLTPAEVLIAIHGIDPDKDTLKLKKVIDAISACFEMRQVFTQQVLASVLNQLVEQIPLPFLFMRTVIQAIGVFPALVEFVMDILSRLVSKQIWKYPKLWVGFLKCAVQTKPQSFGVLLQLPAVHLENALSRNPVLKSSLVEHASQPNIQSTLPRSTLVVLGIVPDPQPPATPVPTSNQAQTSQTQATTNPSSSAAADIPTEGTQEESSPLA